MKKLSHIGISLLLCSIFGSIWYVSEQDAYRQMEALKAERAKVVAEARSNVATQKLHAPESEANRQLLLLGYDGRFEAVAFPSLDGLWYLHQDWRELPLNRSTLSARVAENGELSLLSHYTGKVALGHSQVLVKIGQTVYDSTYIPYYPPHLTKQNTSTYWEVNHYNASADQEIIHQIALAADQEIHVLIRGEQDEIGFQLSKEDKKAIRDCYELSRELQRV